MLDQQGAFEKGGCQMSSCLPNDLLQLDDIQHNKAVCRLQPSPVLIGISQLHASMHNCQSAPCSAPITEEAQNTEEGSSAHHGLPWAASPLLKSVQSSHTGAHNSPTGA